MKKLLFVCALVAGLCCTLIACSDDSTATIPTPDGSDVPESILAQFNQDHPDAQDVRWGRTEDGHYMADFSTPGSADNTAWYGNDGRWDMTKYEIPLDRLPQAVADALAATEYGQSGTGWRVDREVDVLERRDGSETLYIIEASHTDGSEVDLYFTADGILVQELLDAAPDKDYGQFLPQTPDGDLRSWLEERFPGYRLIDVEGEDGGVEVEFVYDGHKYEAFFSASRQWLYYKADLRYGSSLIPAVVKATVEASELMQQGARVDDVEMYVVNAGGTETTYFCFELETRFGDDRELYVRADGTEERPDLGGGSGSGGGMPVEEDIESFLAGQYPGAVVLERDYDDGFLEVTIRHDGVVKEVYFNGRKEWVRTEWETRSLPDAVRQGIEEAGYRISDREFERVETPDRNWYEVEAVKDRREWQLYVGDDGTIYDARRDD